MSIKVNGTTINSLNVGNTQVKKVLVRQNASSGYTTVYFVETYEENIQLSGTTRNAGFDYPDGLWYPTPPITHTITSASGTVKVISAEGVSTGVADVSISGASIIVTLRGKSPRSTAVGTVKVTYEVCFSDTQTYEENIQLSGTTRNIGFDYPDGFWYTTPAITHTITSKSGPVKVISAEGVSTGVADVSIVDDASIQVTLRGKSPRAEAVGAVKVTYEACPIPTHNVVQVSSTASQQFKLNSNGYYESQCKGINNGWSLCKVEFNMAGNYTLQCINNGESNYDFGILSTINNTLQSSNTIDSSNVQKSFKGSSSTSVQSVSYSDVKVGDYIYVKYRKDGSVNSGNDSLKFKVV